MLTRTDIAALIPHAGRMCLLDGVTQWDATTVHAHSATHRNEDNPLRVEGAISTLSLIEYAAQAMAVHGALVGAVAGRPRRGYLVSVRNVVCASSRLPECKADLRVSATQLVGEAERVSYSFSVSLGDAEMLRGTAMVILDAGERSA